MKPKRAATVGIAGAVIAGGLLLGSTGLASASIRPASFLSNQKLLEQQLAARASQLTRLAADVNGSTTLTASDKSTLDANVAAATTNIDALIATVPNDTTNAEVRADRASMVKENRVFAVLTPQVFETIYADSLASEASTDASNESVLQSEVSSIIGEHGYKDAFTHYVDFVKRVNDALAWSAHVSTTVLAQVPADFPGDTDVFVNANVKLRNAGVALAYATYDESVIGLSSGGYSGS